MENGVWGWRERRGRTDGRGGGGATLGRERRNGSAEAGSGSRAGRGKRRGGPPSTGRGRGGLTAETACASGRPLRAGGRKTLRCRWAAFQEGRGAAGGERAAASPTASRTKAGMETPPAKGAGAQRGSWATASQGGAGGGGGGVEGGASKAGRARRATSLRCSGVLSRCRHPPATPRAAPRTRAWRGACGREGRGRAGGVFPAGAGRASRAKQRAGAGIGRGERVWGGGCC